MGGPWEDFAPKDQDGPWNDFSPKDAVSDQTGQAKDLGEALLTNKPTQGMGQAIVRGLPAALGGFVGGIGGVLGGPAGVIGGAALGGAAGESARQGVSQIAAGAFPEAGYPVQVPGQVLRDVGLQGASQGAGQAAGMAIGAGLKAARPLVNKLGAQVMRVGAGIPEKAGEAAMRNPSMIIDAPSRGVASEGYKAFERYTGLKGLGDMVKTTGKFPAESELEQNLFEAAKKAVSGTATPQELYIASQSASSLNQIAKMGNPRYAMLKSAISQAKGVVDDALEAALPEYKNLRADYAAAKAADEFSSFLPLNKNTTPNVLRGVTAATTAAAGTMAGSPIALAALPLVSPKFYGTALKAAAVVGKVPAGVYQMTAQAGSGAAGSSLSDAYNRQR